MPSINLIFCPSLVCVIGR